MEKEQIIELIKVEEQLLWEALKNAKLVFGEDSTAFARAQSRWSSVSTILTRIESYENN